MRIYGLIDGNSFYSSCEAAFDPALIGLPVVVLSNNDACAIARNTPAKKLGVKMGEPFHLVRNKREMQGVRWFSSNFALYGDISRRVYQVIAARVPRAEPYLIDETFLDLTGLPGNLYERCKQLRADVLRIAKIPTCIGWGYTKTIAFYGVALSTRSNQCLPAFIHESLTHILKRTDRGEAASPVTIKGRWRSFSHFTAGVCRSRPYKVGVVSLMRRMVCRLVLNSRAMADTPAPSPSRRATLPR